MKIRWRFKWDYKTINVVFLFYLVFMLSFLIFFYTNKDRFEPIPLDERVFKSNIYLFFDFLFPIFAALNFLIMFSNNFENQTYRYVNSLPVRNIVFFRWIRLYIAMSVPYIISLYITHINIKGSRINMTFADSVFLSFPNFLFLCSCSVFLMVVFRRIFYSIILLGGYVLLDMSSVGSFTENSSLFVNVYGRYHWNEIFWNRIAYLIISIILFSLSCFLVTTKPYKNRE